MVYTEDSSGVKREEGVLAFLRWATKWCRSSQTEEMLICAESKLGEAVQSLQQQSLRDPREEERDVCQHRQE